MKWCANKNWIFRIIQLSSTATHGNTFNRHLTHRHPRSWEYKHKRITISFFRTLPRRDRMAERAVFSSQWQEDTVGESCDSPEVTVWELLVRMLKHIYLDHFVSSFWELLWFDNNQGWVLFSVSLCRLSKERNRTIREIPSYEKKVLDKDILIQKFPGNFHFPLGFLFGRVPGMCMSL